MNNIKSDPRFTGWAFTDAVRFMDCPKCKQTAGNDCHRPSGMRAWPPHKERTSALHQQYGTEPWMHKINESFCLGKVL